MSTAATKDLRELLGDTFTYGEASAAGLGDKRLYRLRDSGEIVALGGGVYRWAEARRRMMTLSKSPSACRGRRCVWRRLWPGTVLSTRSRLRSTSRSPVAAPGLHSGRRSACTSSTGVRSILAGTYWTSAPADRWAFTLPSVQSLTRSATAIARA